MGFIQKVLGFIIHPNPSRTAAIVIFLVLSAIVPVTLFVSQQQQNTQQRASGLSACDPACNSSEICQSINEGDSTSYICVSDDSVSTPNPVVSDVSQITPTVSIQSGRINCGPTLTCDSNTQQCGEFVDPNNKAPNYYYCAPKLFTSITPNPTPTFTPTPTSPPGRINCGPILTCDSNTQQCGEFVDPNNKAPTYYYCAPKLFVSTTISVPTPTFTPTPTLKLELITVTASPSAAYCYLRNRGDANCDNRITRLDLDVNWLAEFLKEVKGISTPKTSDFNNDGKVNIVDFNIWRIGIADSSLVH